MPAKMALTALLALGAENLLFAGGNGFSRALRSAQRPGSIGRYALLVTWFSLLSALAGAWIGPHVSASGAQAAFLRPMSFAAAAAAAYLLTAGVLRGFFPALYRRTAQLLAPAAVNTIVLAVPFVQGDFSMSLSGAAGYALGTGAAFYSASSVLAHAEPGCRNADMPESFRGLPATLLYVGILSMAFAAFAGGKVF